MCLLNFSFILFSGYCCLASQMWCLGRFLPLIVGVHVPEHDSHWRCYLQLLQILTLSTAVEVTVDTAAMLRLLVKDYLVDFNRLYPGSMTPKLHYLLHLPDQMKL